jgi:3-keto-disaccharide hydrolase
MKARTHPGVPLRFAILALFACLGLSVLWPILARSAEPEALSPIFNGKDLAGWQVPDPNPFWRVVDGVLIGENDAARKGHVLYTKKPYKDFIIEMEARWSGEIDSGIMLREPELQLQIGISRSLKKDMTCSFYTNAKEKYPEAGQAKDLEKFLKPGDWNQIRLQAKGDTFTAWLNGQKVVEYKDSRFPNPYAIGLQIHPGLVMKIEFRNIRLKDLDEHG